MDDTTSFILDHTEEDILTYTTSDEALEGAAGTEVWVAASCQGSYLGGISCCKPDYRM
jgi:hypothetical protein